MAAASSLSSSSCHLLHCVRLPPSPFPVPFLKRLLCDARTTTITAGAAATALCLQASSSSTTFRIRSLQFSTAVSLVHHNALIPQSQLEIDTHDDDDDRNESSVDDYVGEETEAKVENTKLEGTVNERVQSVVKVKPPSLTVKEKKELASYAHSLGKELRNQQVGKLGVTASVVSAFIENLEANELLKVKIHGNCPRELADVVKQLEEATGSVVVGQIGRTVILYRPSFTKLKAEEKRMKMKARRASFRKDFKTKPTSVRNEQVTRLSGRGRRGNSRFSSST